jgi:hypothetical protein
LNVKQRLFRHLPRHYSDAALDTDFDQSPEPQKFKPAAASPGCQTAGIAHPFAVTDVIPDSAPIEFTCPQCKKKISKTIDWLKTATACPFCGCPIDSSKFGPGVDKANKEINDAWQKLKDSFFK